MLELLFLPQHTAVSAPPSQHPSASADPSLHRSNIDMSSIHHAPTAENYLHPTAALTVMLKPLHPAVGSFVSSGLGLGLGFYSE